MPTLRRPHRLLCLAVTAAAAFGVTGPAHAQGFAGLLPSGGVRLPSGARSLGRLSGVTHLRATVTLSPRDPEALAAYATAVSNPSSVDYHRYLSVAAFRQRFAPRAAAIAAVGERLRADGLTVAAPSANGLSLPVSATAATASAAFHTAIVGYALADGRRGTATTSTPHLAGTGSLVQSIVGLNSVAPRSSLIVEPHAHAARALRSASPISSTVEGAGCAAVRSTAELNDSHTAAQIAAEYGLSGFYAAGDTGKGVTVALYELEPFSASDIAAYQSCYGTDATVETENIDGGAGSGAGSGEAASDIEDVIGLAPGATIRVYEGPATGNGAFDTYNAIVSDDAAQVISTSWGLCEALEGAGSATAEDTLFQEAAAQGQTVVAASGDSGADDCGNHTRAVDDPSSQPWVTAVGGTSLNAGVQTTWNDSFGASGGGTSQLWAQPSYQAGAVPAQSAISCGATGTSCRETPDISADADPNHGYAAYWQGSWQTVGGTSLAAPTVASLVVLADGSPACGGQALGFINPALYADAHSDYAADFSDITTGSNNYDGVPGYAAAPGFDMATGLGTPAVGLGAQLCDDAVTVTAPAAQRWSTGHQVALQLSATSAKHAVIHWTATGLPAGVAINPATGVISGTPTIDGGATITVTAIDGDGAQGQTTFTATVTGAATTTAAKATTASDPVRLHRVRNQTSRRGAHVRVRLSAQAAAGLRLRFSATGLPRGLHIDARTGVISGTARGSARNKVTVRATDAAGQSGRTTFSWTVRGR